MSAAFVPVTDLTHLSQTTIVATFDDSGRPTCPFNNCGGHSVNLGGSTRGLKYAFMCEVCGKRWHQLRVPDMLGNYMVTESNRSVGVEPRRSGGYACGKCGFKPKFGHICPYKNSGGDNLVQQHAVQSLPLLPSLGPHPFCRTVMDGDTCVDSKQKRKNTVTK